MRCLLDSYLVVSIRKILCYFEFVLSLDLSLRDEIRVRVRLLLTDRIQIESYRIESLMNLYDDGQICTICHHFFFC